jgi:RNA 3'-terminal phosphate cyclase
LEQLIVLWKQKYISECWLAIRIFVERTTSCLLAVNALGKRDISASGVGIQPTEELLNDLSHAACVDCF